MRTLWETGKCAQTARENAEIQAHTQGHMRSTLDWSWKDQTANRGDVALFRQKQRTPWSWYRTPFVQKSGKEFAFDRSYVWDGSTECRTRSYEKPPINNQWMSKSNDENDDGLVTPYEKSLEILPDRRLNRTLKKSEVGDVQSRPGEEV